MHNFSHFVLCIAFSFSLYSSSTLLHASDRDRLHKSDPAKQEESSGWFSRFSIPTFSDLKLLTPQLPSLSPCNLWLTIGSFIWAFGSFLPNMNAFDFIPRYLLDDFFAIPVYVLYVSSWSYLILANFAFMKFLSPEDWLLPILDNLRHGISFSLGMILANVASSSASGAYLTTLDNIKKYVSIWMFTALSYGIGHYLCLFLTSPALEQRMTADSQTAVIRDAQVALPYYIFLGLGLTMARFFNLASKTDLNKRVIQATFSTSQVVGGFLEGDCCGICHSEHTDEKIIALPCGDTVQHIFHQNCIEKWWKQQDGEITCPICRRCFVQ